MVGRNRCKVRFRFLGLSAPLSYLAAIAGVFLLTLGAGGTGFAQEPIKLGVLNDLTGAFADLGGHGSVVAAQMAIDDLGGKVLGRPVTIAAADSQNKPDVAVSIARQWFDADKFEAILDPVPSSVALAVVGLARERNKMVIIASSGAADLTGKACSHTSFQWAYDTSVLAKGTAQTVVKAGGTLGYVEREVRDGRGRLVAKAASTCMKRTRG